MEVSEIQVINKNEAPVNNEWSVGLPIIQGEVDSPWSEGMSVWNRFIINSDKWEIRHRNFISENGQSACEIEVMPKQPEGVIEVNGTYQDMAVSLSSDGNEATYYGNTYQKLPFNFARANFAEEPKQHLVYRGVGHGELENISRSGFIKSGHVVELFEPRKEGSIPVFFATNINTPIEYAVQGRVFDQVQFRMPVHILETKYPDQAELDGDNVKVFGKVEAKEIESVIEIIPFQIHGFSFNLYQESDGHWRTNLNPVGYWSDSGDKANKYFFRRIEGQELSQLLHLEESLVTVAN